MQHNDQTDDIIARAHAAFDIGKILVPNHENVGTSSSTKRAQLITTLKRSDQVLDEYEQVNQVPERSLAHRWKWGRTLYTGIKSDRTTLEELMAESGSRILSVLEVVEEWLETGRLAADLSSTECKQQNWV